MINNDFLQTEFTPESTHQKVTPLVRISTVASGFSTELRTAARKIANRKEDENAEHFDELAGAAKRAWRMMKRMKVPFAYCVYRKGEEVRLDIAELDGRGKMKAVSERDITHENFGKWATALDRAEGVILDLAA